MGTFGNRIRLLASAGLVLFLGGAAGAADHAVDVGVAGFNFFPAEITIQAGDTVTWTWVGGNHSVNSGANCTPDGLFDSPISAVNGTTFPSPPGAFATPGTYEYHCGVGTHCSFFNMKATVIVEEAAPPPPNAVPSMDIWALSATALLIATVTLGTLGVQRRRARNGTPQTRRR